jgi:hypothetical protein
MGAYVDLDTILAALLHPWNIKKHFQVRCIQRLVILNFTSIQQDRLQINNINIENEMMIEQSICMNSNKQAIAPVSCITFKKHYYTTYLWTSTSPRCFVIAHVVPRLASKDGCDISRPYFLTSSM